MQLDKNNIISYLLTNKNNFSKNYHITNIGLFGSYAVNNQTNFSDIDVIVSFEEDKYTFDNYMNLKFLLEDYFGKKIDLIIEKSIKKELKQQILNQAIYV